HYSWSGPAGTGPFGDVDHISVTKAGTYSVHVTDANACAGDGSGALTVDEKPSVSVNNAEACGHSNVAAVAQTLTASIAAGTGTGTLHYAWSGPAGTGPFGDVDHISVTSGGTYHVVVTDGKTCTGSGDGILTVDEKPSVTVNNAEACGHSNVADVAQTLTASIAAGTGTGTPHYAWSGPAGTGPFGDVDHITVTQGGTYHVVVTDGK